MTFRALLIAMFLSSAAYTQPPPIEPGVSLELAKWRAVHYSDVRYKLNLTLEKMSPVLKGTMEIRVRVSGGEGENGSRGAMPIVLDWRKIKGFQDRSTISNVSVNGNAAVSSKSDGFSRSSAETPKGVTLTFAELDDHLIFSEGVVTGENVIKLDFTSPILPSGSAITRYVDKEDGSEYIYSLFVPSDTSTAFPVFDQPDLKARFELSASVPTKWTVISNAREQDYRGRYPAPVIGATEIVREVFYFEETKPISTYVFAFAAGPFERVERGNLSGSEGSPLQRNVSGQQGTLPTGRVSASDAIYVRKSQAAKFKPHAAEAFRLNREAVKYFEEYFDYKFPWPKYDLVLIPEFPFGGMEHAGATFLREAAVIFPQEPTRNDHISRATLIFHEAAHQWFGDTVTMRWFDDLWLKEGFATFTAYKAMERIMPEMNAWKVFYERVKQTAYQTDSTRGTTPIYQEIKNLSAAKSAYGAIVYNKAPAFLRQAEFYLGEDKFRAAVRAFLKKHEFGNAGWEDLVKEFEVVEGGSLKQWAKNWVKERGLSIVPIRHLDGKVTNASFMQSNVLGEDTYWLQRVQALKIDKSHRDIDDEVWLGAKELPLTILSSDNLAVIPNYQDYGYGIFLLDEKSRDYVLKNIQNEKDPFLRAMMWGSLWDSVREGELDPREYVELVVKVLGKSDGFSRSSGETPKGVTLTEDESTTALLLNRVGTALNYYLSEPPASAGGKKAADLRVRKGQRLGNAVSSPPAYAGGSDIRGRVEDLLIERMRNAGTVGQRITFYRAFLNAASTERARTVLKDILNLKFQISDFKLKAKDKFDIVTRLLILGDQDAAKLLTELEKAETSDDAKRYAYAARAGVGTAENKAKYWKDFTENKEISESWIEAAFGPWNSIGHSQLTLPYLERALRELPNHKRNRKIFFVNGWLGAFIGGQRSEEALAIVNKFLADNPRLDNDLRLKILENVDVIERAVRIRAKYAVR